MKKTIYVSGPMSGLPDLNFPAFHAAAAELRALGHTVVNPAEKQSKGATLEHHVAVQLGFSVVGASA